MAPGIDFNEYFRPHYYSLRSTHWMVIQKSYRISTHTHHTHTPHTHTTHTPHTYTYTYTYTHAYTHIHTHTHTETSGVSTHAHMHTLLRYNACDVRWKVRSVATCAFRPIYNFISVMAYACTCTGSYFPVMRYHCSETCSKTGTSS